MESSPTNIDATSEVSDKKEAKKKDKKNAKAGRLMGAFAVQPETADSKKTGSLWPESPRQESDARKDTQEHAVDLENEAPADELSPDEQQFIERELVRAAEGAEPVAFEDLPEDDPERPVREFRQRVVEGEASEKAAAEILHDLIGVPATEAPIPETVAEEPDFDEPGQPEENLPAQAGTPAAPESETSEASEPSPPATNRRGSGGRPPMPPAAGAPGAGAGDEHFRQLPPVAPIRAWQPNAAPPPLSGTESYDHGNPAAAALLGGIIGYLIGRRRGRIKSEKKLVPVQKKLQKEVVNLQWQLQSKEAKIRSAAREHSRLPVEQPARAEPAKQPHASTSAAVFERQPAAGAIKRERQTAPEAAALHSKQQTRERIGQVIVNAETVPRPKKEGYIPPDPKTLEKTYHTMSRAELLRISEKIIIDGTSLRRIYENRLIGERGLRRLVTEHFRKGGDIKRQLRREVVEREIDFERDPVMRDHASTQPGGAAGGAAARSGLQVLLDQAATAIPANPDEVAYYKARAEFDAKEKYRQKKQQRVMDGALTLTILVLLIIIVTLFLSRH